jgi:hypothetical protein
MNFDEFESKLRSQPRREIPREWRREILGPLRPAPSAPGGWWRQLLWPHPAAWASLAAAWVAIVALNRAGAPEAAPHQIASRPSRDMVLAYQERQRLWAELASDKSEPRKPMPAVDRPRSYVRVQEAVV